MEIVLIVGKSNAGKSTLVRGLSGAGQVVRPHPDVKNTALLIWSPKTIERTLVLDGSVNEGALYQIVDAEEYPKGATTSPSHLRNLLDLYSVDNEPYSCTRAIICISASITPRKRPVGWTLADYERVINGGGLVGHNVTHTISLIKDGTQHNKLININAAGLNQIAIAGAPNPPNLVAEAARRFIGLV